MLESKYLKDNVQNIQKMLTIPALKSFETVKLGKLLRLSKIREYQHGELIIREGDTDQWLYFLLSGKVRVKKEGVELVIIDRIGELFGEMTVLDGLTRSASVFAEGKTICLAVDVSGGAGAGCEDKRAETLLFLYNMIAEYVSSRLRITNEELVWAKKELQKLKGDTSP
jgi:CRP/FNR family transcriptional regulator, cyclic AMP receptor protein